MSVCDPLGEDAERACSLNVDQPGRRGPIVGRAPSIPPSIGRPSGHLGAVPAARADRPAGLVEDHRERARTWPAEDEPEARVVADPGGPADLGDPIVQVLDALRLERPGGDEIERRAEDEEHGERAEAAPGDEAPADAPDQPGVGGERLASRRRRRARRRRRRQASLSR